MQWELARVGLGFVSCVNLLSTKTCLVFRFSPESTGVVCHGLEGPFYFKIGFETMPHLSQRALTIFCQRMAPHHFIVVEGLACLCHWRITAISCICILFLGRLAVSSPKPVLHALFRVDASYARSRSDAIFFWCRCET